MKKLLILSGKGGTGKTTTAAAFTRFAKARAMADCDVDAPNLHLVTGMEAEPAKSPFMGGSKATIHFDACVGCGRCFRACRFHAIRRERGKFQVMDYACEGCGVCVKVCPRHAVDLTPDVAGTVSLWQDEEKTFSSATLKMGRGNSGKLVSQVKNTMEKAAPADVPLAVIDGSPGIGCPVISSVSGVDLVLIVAEPSRSGLSDLERLLKTASMLRARTAVCVNKYDVSPEKTQAIRNYCREQQVPFVGKIPYDPLASRAINQGMSLADFDCPARDALYEVFRNTMAILEDEPSKS